jgi:hypothetical protein
LYELNQSCEFFLFFGPERFVLVQLTSSPPFPYPSVASPLNGIVMPLCRVTLPSHWVKTSSIRHLSATLCPTVSPSRTGTETEALNLHHHRNLPFLDRLTLTLFWCKKIISALITLSTTQPRLYFAFSLGKTPGHQSSIHHRRSLSPFSHVHHPSAQWHPRWWISRHSFTS